MPSERLIELEKGACLGGARRCVERLLLLSQEVIDHSISGVWKREIQLAIFRNSLGGAEEEKLVFDNWTAHGQTVIVSAQRQRVRPRRRQKDLGLETVDAEEVLATGAVEKVDNEAVK